MAAEVMSRLERTLLLHLLDNRGQQVRFEASQWTTEFGILRRFSEEDPSVLRGALRSLEMARMIYQRTQYVVGYSEPKHVYSLTPTGHRKALEIQSVGGRGEETRAGGDDGGTGGGSSGAGRRRATDRLAPSS
jgi:hypothetical protein